MTNHVIVGALLALAVVATGAAAAAPGNAPVNEPMNQSAAAGQTAAAAHANATIPTVAADTPPATSDGQGPPDQLPDSVPGFVAEIHDLVRAHVSVSLDGMLGHDVVAVTPGGAAAGQPAASPTG